MAGSAACLLIQAPRIAAGILLLCALLDSPAAQAQETPDTTLTVRSDTLQPPASDLIPERAPIGFREPEEGRIVVDELPVRLPVLDATGILGAYPFSFAYEFGTPGWPDAWSPYGLRPENTALLLNGLPYEDLITGRPRYDLLPLDLLLPLRVGAARQGAPVSVLTAVRPFDTPEPLTELRYRSGASGFQAITALHAQTRRATLFGRSGTLNVLGSYGGRAADGEYPNSDLRRERKLLGRIRFERPGWSLELLNYHARRRIGAHGGVIPPIYQRFGAQVLNPSARRQTIRNDLSATLRAHLIGGLEAPAALTGFWTSQVSRYTVGGDTLTLDADRYGLAAEQDLTSLRPTLTLRATGWLDTYEGVDPDTARFGRSRMQLHAALADSVSLGPLKTGIAAGVHWSGHALFPSASADVSWPLRIVSLYAKGLVTGRSSSWAERFGFGSFVAPTEKPGQGLISQLEAGVQTGGPTFDVMIGGFASVAAREIDLRQVQGDTAQVFASERPVRRMGLSADLGWRRTSERGFYATFQPNLTYVVADEASSGSALLRNALPVFHATGRLGARYVLFQGDLDLDLYLNGRFWTEMNSRTLHPPTGMLVLPLASSERIGPSGLLSAYLQASVRTAIIFLAYENVLSSSTGGGLYEGTLLVPVYPLPERRFRFGVYWPISG